MSNSPHRDEERRIGIASSVLSRIEVEGLTPTPRSHFVLREGFVWGSGVLSVAVGALGVATLLFAARYSEWELYRVTHESLLTFAAELMPYAWLAVLIVFTILAYESVRHTKRGYRYAVPTLVCGAFGMALLCGTLLYAVGGGYVADTYLAQYVPQYLSLEERKMRMWDKPERGIVAGMVTDVAATGDTFTLRSSHNVLHTIHMDMLGADARQDVVEGTMLRVLAPLVSRPEFAVHDEADQVFAATAASDDSMEADTSMMMTMESAPAVQDADAFAATVADGEQVRMMKSSPLPENTEPPRSAYLREACTVLPLSGVGVFDESRRDALRECIDALDTAREVGE